MKAGYSSQVPPGQGRVRLVPHDFTVGSTQPTLHVDVCSNCHPFYTGKQTIVDTAGQVERFQKRLERSARELTPLQPTASARPAGTR